MGRGRAKAKQTKVARELKYRSLDTDFSSLARELGGSSDEPEVPAAYADLADGPLPRAQGDDQDGLDGSPSDEDDEPLRKSG